MQFKILHTFYYRIMSIDLADPQIIHAIKSNNKYIEVLSEECLTNNFLEAILMINPTQIKHWPYYLITQKMVNIIIELCKYELIKFVPSRFITYNMAKIIIKSIPILYGKYIPPQFYTDELRNICLESLKTKINKTAKYFLNIPYSVKKEFPEIITLALSRRGTLISRVPDDLLTYDLCVLALKSTDRQHNILSNIPGKYRDYNMCNLAIKRAANDISEVPYQMLRDNPELVYTAVYNHGGSIEFVPKNLIDYKTAKLAIRSSIDALPFVPPQLFLDFPQLNDDVKYKQDINAKNMLSSLKNKHNELFFVDKIGLNSNDQPNEPNEPNEPKNKKNRKRKLLE